MVEKLDKNGEKFHALLERTDKTFEQIDKRGKEESRQIKT